MIAIGTHALLSRDAVERLDKSVIDRLILTDTVKIPEEKLSQKMKIVSVAKIFGEAIKRVHDGESVSALFEF